MKNLRECIDELTREFGLSKTELSDRLGYRSRTSLDRIINENSGAKSVQKFEQTLLKTFPLTERQKADLHQAIQLAIYGEEKYLTALKMWDFVHGVSPAPTDGLRVTCAKDRAAVELSERYAGARNLRATVINCQYVVPLFGLLKELLRRGGTVKQYLYVNSDSSRTVSAVNSMMTIFYEKNYGAYVRYRQLPDAASPDCGFNEADMMMVSWTGPDDGDHADLILFSTADSGVLIETSPFGDAFLDIAGVNRAHYLPIKRTYFTCTAFEDYIQYSRDYAALEYNHAIWKIKPDIGVDEIPAWILKRAVQEGPIPQDESFSGILDALERIYRKRYENTCTKRKHAYNIHKRSAMYRFALTGRTTDHFWGMRPFTPGERIVILSELLKQQIQNPYIHMSFLKDDSAIQDVEIAYYEGVGMLILASDTDYNLEDGHSEVMITHQELLKLYKEFFTEVLLRDYVCTESETCDYLRYLLKVVESLDSE